MKPSVGRIVHFNFDFKHTGEETSVFNAALIVAVNEDGTVNLQVFYPDGKIEFLSNIQQGDAFEQWNWPQRV